MKPISAYADLIPLKEFVEAVRTRCFIDYDGNGYYATDKEESDVYAIPSEIFEGQIDWAWTHVAWYNK